MKRIAVLCILSSLLLGTTVLLAHITPPRVLMSDMDAARHLMPGAQTFTKTNVKLTKEQKQEVKKLCNWNPDESQYPVLVGRDAQGRFLGTVTFIGEIGIHGLVRLAVSVDPAGKVMGASVVSITDEAYGWVKPLVDENFTKEFVGKDHHDAFVQGQRVAARRGSMPEFYKQVLASLVQRCAVICYVSDVSKAAKL